MYVVWEDNSVGNIQVDAQKIAEGAKVVHMKLSVEKVLENTDASGIVPYTDHITNIDKNDL